jgi:RNA polymerase-binding transcription factor DksA
MDLEHSRQRLTEEHERLDQLVAGFRDEHLTDESENQSVFELSDQPQHQADLGTETFHREADLSLLEQVEAELADVEHALRRIDEGTYGTCEACGRPIGDDRLEVLPAARFCLEDQSVAEREARSASS